MSQLGILAVTARQLWSSAPRWRLTVAAAMLCTAAWLLDQGIGPQAPTPPSTPPPASPPRQPQPPVSSGPLAPVRPIDPATESRLGQFYRAYTTAMAATGQGRQCELAVTALRGLHPGDDAYAYVAVPQKTAIDATRKNCVAQIDQSDLRVKAALDAFDAYERAPSIASASRAVDEGRRLSADFDRTRDFQRRASLLADTDDLADKLARHQALAARAAATAPLYRAGDPATLEAATVLADLGQQLASLPFGALSGDAPPHERDAMTAIGRARADLAEADRLTAVVKAALARAGSDPTALVIALSALSDFDRARATATGVDLAAAQASARDALPGAIASVAARYAEKPARAEADALRNLGAMAEKLGATLDRKLGETVATARRHLADSAIRLAALRETASTWSRRHDAGSRDPALEDRVRTVWRVIGNGSGELNAFDAPAAQPEHRAALATLRTAMLEIGGHVGPDDRRWLTVYPDTRSLRAETAVTQGIPIALVRQLAEAGYAVVRTPGEAALVLTAADPSLRGDGYDAQGRQQRRVAASVSLTWNYAGTQVPLGVITGEGAERDAAKALAAAVQVWAGNTVEALSARLSAP